MAPAEEAVRWARPPCVEEEEVSDSDSRRAVSGPSEREVEESMSWVLSSG